MTFEQAAALPQAGQLVPVIDGPYKLSEAREAFRRFGAGAHNGKVVITMD